MYLKLMVVNSYNSGFKDGARGVRDVAFIHYLSCTYSSNQACNFHALLLWLMLPRDHFASRFLYFTTAGIKCCVAAVKRCPVLHFSVIIFFWSFGIIDASIIKCWELSTTQAGARGHVGCCTYLLSLKYRLNQTESAISM
jgi:hypothetical protein